MGIDEGYDEGFDDDGFDDDLGDDEGEPTEKKKRIATSTKIVLVVAGWLLLTLFLVGEFSEDKTPTDTVEAQLDTVDDVDGEIAEEDVVIDEEAALESFDADGDGVLSESERAAAVEAYEAAVASGEISIGEAWKGVTGGIATATEEGVGESAAPGAAPPSGAGTSDGSGGTSSGSGSGSDSGSTTTTATAGGGGGGGSTTTTAKPSGGGTTDTTVKPSTTTTPTTTEASPPPPPPGSPPVDRTITISGNLGVGFAYSPRNFTVPAGSRISMVNNSSRDHTWKLGDGPDEPVVKEATVGPRVVTETVTYRCTIVAHNLSGTITVE